MKGANRGGGEADGLRLCLSSWFNGLYYEGPCPEKKWRPTHCNNVLWVIQQPAKQLALNKQKGKEKREADDEKAMADLLKQQQQHGLSHARIKWITLDVQVVWKTQIQTTSKLVRTISQFSAADGKSWQQSVKLCSKCLVCFFMTD